MLKDRMSRVAMRDRVTVLYFATQSCLFVFMAKSTPCHSVLRVQQSAGVWRWPAEGEEGRRLPR